MIVLNGTSSSGKSALAAALQDLLDEPYLHAEGDLLRRMLPRRLGPERGEAFGVHGVVGSLPLPPATPHLPEAGTTSLRTG